MKQYVFMTDYNLFVQLCSTYFGQRRPKLLLEISSLFTKSVLLKLFSFRAYIQSQSSTFNVNNITLSDDRLNALRLSRRNLLQMEKLLTVQSSNELFFIHCILHLLIQMQDVNVIAVCACPLQERKKVKAQYVGWEKFVSSIEQKKRANFYKGMGHHSTGVLPAQYSL